MAQFISSPPQLGHLLASARRHKGLTQAQAAARVGISQSRLSVLESTPDALTVAQLLSLAAAYDLRLALHDKAVDTPAAEW